MAKNKTIVLRGAFETSEDELQEWSTGSGADYTVPSGRELVIKNIRLINNTDTDYYAYLKIGINSGTLHCIWPQKDVPARDGFSEDCNIVVRATEAVFGLAENTGVNYVLTCLERDA